MNLPFRAVLLILAFSLSVPVSMQGEASRPARQYVIYVSPKGDDAHAGSRHRPMATVEGALERARVLRAEGKGREGIVIQLKAGTWPLSDALTSRTDSIVLNDVHDVVLTGSGKASTILSGEISVSDWEWAADRPGVLVASLPASLDLGQAAGRQHRIDLYCDGRRQQLARWPNEGFTKAGRALGATDIPVISINVHGTREGIFEYVDERIDEWSKEKEPYLHGYWYWDWSEESQQVESIDTQSRTFSLMKPYHKYGYRDKMNYYGFNLLCELDAAGEYYVDRESHRIYWKPCAGYKAGKSRVTLSAYDGEAAIVFRNCTDVTLRNMTLRGVRNRGIVVEGGKNVTIEKCHLTAIGDNAITLEQGTGHRVTGCFIHELGCSGIVTRGGNRRTLEPCGFVISDNVVQDFSLYKRTYEPAVFFHGAGITVTHNRFQGSSSSAMRAEGNDIDIAYNQFFDLVEESDDQGGLDSFYDFSFRRISVRNNHWRNIVGGTYCGAAAVRFDDLISGQEVLGNVFEHCGGGGFGAVQINGGKDNMIKGNVFYDCQWALSYGVLYGESWNTAYNRADHLKKLEDVDCFSEVYLSRYPELREEPGSARGRNFLLDNLLINAKKISTHKDCLISYNNTLVTDTTASLAHYLDPAVLNSYGILPIPFGSIGPRKDCYPFGE